jgi:hypothetical protein
MSLLSAHSHALCFFFLFQLTDVPCLSDGVSATRGMLEEQIFALKKASESRLEGLKKEAVAVRASTEIRLHLYLLSSDLCKPALLNKSIRNLNPYLRSCSNDQ